MEHRMSLRVPIRHAATIKAGFRGTIAGELCNISFDGAYFVTNGKLPEALLKQHVSILVKYASGAANLSVTIGALVVRVDADAAGLEFTSYDDNMKDYLERVYGAHLSPNSERFAVAT